MQLTNSQGEQEEVKEENLTDKIDMNDLDKAVDELPDVDVSFDGSQSSFEMEDEEFDLGLEELDQAE